jgi:hypothetical protein
VLQAVTKVEQPLEVGRAERESDVPVRVQQLWEIPLAAPDRDSARSQRLAQATIAADLSDRRGRISPFRPVGLICIKASLTNSVFNIIGDGNDVN